MSIKLAFFKELSFLKKFGILILLLVLIGFPLFIATVKASPLVTLDNTSSGSTSWQHTTSSNSNMILIVGITGFNSSVSSVTYNGVTLTRLKSTTFNVTNTLEIWYLLNPPSGTHTITINGSFNGLIGGAATYYNVDTSNPFGAIGSNTGMSNPGSTSVTINANTSQLVVDTAGWLGNVNGIGPGGGQTALWSQPWMGAPQISNVGSSKPGTGGNTTMSWGSIQGIWAEIAVAINSVSPTPTATPMPTPNSNCFTTMKFYSQNSNDLVAGFTTQMTNTTTGSTTTSITDATGYATFNNICAGTYDVCMSDPNDFIGSSTLTFDGSNVSGTQSVPRCVPPTSTPTPTPSAPTPTPAGSPTYTISGNVFNDTNKNKIRDNGEQNYPAAVDITATGGTTSTNNGSYTVNGLPAGTYTISYTNLPSGYVMIYPKNAIPPSFSVTVGPSCNVDNTTGATCNNGNISNLNFAITNSIPWMQLSNADIRVDNGITNKIPASPNAQCGGSYTITQDAQATNPGILFTGDTTADFGQGQASSNNWIVGGAVYPETLSQSITNLRTSYNSLLTLADHNKLTITDLATLPTCTNFNNCTLPPNLPNGIYQTNGDLTLNTYTFPVDKNYIFLINGNLTIQGNITIPNGSTALFSSAGNINIDKNVKAATNTCPPPAGQLQGTFSADKNFVIQGNNDCQIGPDNMLNIEGSVIVNATRSGGSFQNQRDLCGDNPNYPSVTIKPRPDFLLNAPTFFMQQTIFFEEQNP